MHPVHVYPYKVKIPSEINGKGDCERNT